MGLYISQRAPVIVTALATIAALAGFGILSLEQAFAGFSSSATLSIGAMFVLSAGLIRTGALEPLIAKLADWADGSYFKLIMALILTVPLSSAFINNTPVVVMMVPVMMTLGRKFEISPSSLMMPLSFLAIIGGTCTLIGTSTNLLIDEIYRSETDTHLTMFEFLPIGLTFLAIGGV